MLIWWTGLCLWLWVYLVCTMYILLLVCIVSTIYMILQVCRVSTMYMLFRVCIVCTMYILLWLCLVCTMCILLWVCVVCTMYILLLCVCAHYTTAFTRTLKQVANSGINNTLAQKKLVSLKTPPRLYFLSYTSENLICYRRPHSTSMCVEIFRKYWKMWISWDYK